MATKEIMEALFAPAIEPQEETLSDEAAGFYETDPDYDDDEYSEYDGDYEDDEYEDWISLSDTSQWDRMIDIENTVEKIRDYMSDDDYLYSPEDRERILNYLEGALNNVERAYALLEDNYHYIG